MATENGAVELGIQSLSAGAKQGQETGGGASEGMFLKPGLGRFLTGKSVPKVFFARCMRDLGMGVICGWSWVDSRARMKPLLEGRGRWEASISGCWDSLQR